MIESLISALGLELGLTSREIADVVWLALQMQESDRPTHAGSNSSVATATQPQELPQLRSPDEPFSPPETTSREKPQEEPAAGLYNPDQNASGGMAGALSLRVPDARSLREPLSLARALKPLLRLVAAGQSTTIDEAATVEQIIEQQVWLPVLKPSLEPVLELALVVDESVSMQIWQRTIQDLQRFLTHYGVFRDVRVWGLLSDEQGRVRVRPGIGKAGQRQSLRLPSELLDPSGRRLIFVVTDCVGDLWRDGKIQPVMKLWATSGPMAIVQMLPEWLWSRTRLGFAASVRLRAALPGMPNQQLEVRDLSPWDEIDWVAGVKVPVVTLEPEPFGAWAQMMIGKGSAWSAGVVLEPEVAGQSEIDWSQNDELTAGERVQQFRVTASPIARRLAGLLAAAPVISLPVVRIIQDRLLTESQQVHVAEVFLGGLLKPLVEITAEMNVDAVQYEFLDGVREVLLESVRTSETVNVLNEVSQFVAERLRLTSEQFTAILRSPPQVTSEEVLGNILPFATITAQILHQLGGEYMKFADELEKTIQIVHQLKPTLKVKKRQMSVQEIRKFFHNANPANFLDIENVDDRKCYIDLSSVQGREINKELKRTVILSNEISCQWFTGNRGSGKSTELLRLKADLTQQGFHIVYFDSSEDLDMTDVDISDILLAIARRVHESLKEQETNVEVGYFKKLFAEVFDLLQTPLQLSNKTDLSIEIAKITAQAKESPQLRNQLREILEPRTRTILESINEEFLEKSIGKLKEQGKKGLVVIIDNLDRIGSRLLPSGRSQSEYLFIDRGEQLRSLKCHIVYTVPLELTFSHRTEVMMGSRITPKILFMIPVLYRDGRSCLEGLALLQQMIMTRAFPDLSPSAQLERITDIFDHIETLDRLCRISGGHMRNLLSLLYSCLQKQDPPITRNQLEDAITERREHLRMVINSHEWEVLRQIAKHKSLNINIPEHQTFLRNLLVFQYQDEQGVWADVNPLLLELEAMQQ
jgi:nucleoside-triphosphatase THEP1